MAYKFQLGQARLSGSVIQEGNVTAESSQMSASTIALDDASGIAGDGMENQSGNLGISALGVTNAMLAGNIASSKIAELNNFDTADLAEGTNLYYTEARWDAKLAAADTGDLAEGSNLYYTDARARAAVSVDLSSNGGRGSVSYNSSTGVISYEGVTQAEIRGDISVNDVGGDGSLAYNSTTGVITYTGPSAAEVRAHLSVSDSNSIDMSLANGDFSADVLVDDSSLEIDAANGVQVKALGITNSMLSGGIASTKIAELNNFTTSDLAEGSNLYYTTARWDAKMAAADTGDLAEGSNLYYTDARVHAALSVADSTSIDMSYDAAGEFSAVIQPLGVTNAMLSGAIASSKIAELNAFDTDDLAEGASNLYYTQARWDAAFAAEDTDGLSEGASNLYYTDARVRAAVSVSDTNSLDMSFSSATGVFSGDVLVDSDALEVTVNGVALKSTIAGNRTFNNDVTIVGDLAVQGALTYIETTNLSVADALITVGSGSSAFAGDYGLEFGAQGAGWASIKTSLDIDGNGLDGFEFSHPIKASEFHGLFVGSMIESVQTLTAGATIDEANGVQILLDHATAQSFTLPSAASIQGLVLKIKRIGSGESTIVPNGSELLEGASEIKLESQGAAVSIISDGTDYHVI